MLNKSLPDLRDPQRGALGFHSCAISHTKKGCVGYDTASFWGDCFRGESYFRDSTNLRYSVLLGSSWRYLAKYSLAFATSF